MSTALPEFHKEVHGGKCIRHAVGKANRNTMQSPLHLFKAGQLQAVPILSTTKHSLPVDCQDTDDVPHA